MFVSVPWVFFVTFQRFLLTCYLAVLSLTKGTVYFVILSAVWVVCS